MRFRQSLFLLVLFLGSTAFNCDGDPKADLNGTWVFDEEAMIKELGSEDQNNPFLSVGQGILSTIKLEVSGDSVTYRSLNKEKIFLSDINKLNKLLGYKIPTEMTSVIQSKEYM